ncbi:unnamed protein product [Ostreobium quekettii]|uniref:Uncharacterized protein n=1 Tax=Ostreobium quekettii TaxID=121088 RepID=A0A8S1JE97_9CHLO|nr:unnamed protein product [Ostreobium quekettii]|eukprot:evm.model.scf_189EXC.9 EVM.evm.TU.scf_189EXC.9   scf_189EXC:92605-94239(-)
MFPEVAPTWGEAEQMASEDGQSKVHDTGGSRSETLSGVPLSSAIVAGVLVDPPGSPLPSQATSPRVVVAESSMEPVKLAEEGARKGFKRSLPKFLTWEKDSPFNVYWLLLIVAFILPPVALIGSLGIFRGKNRSELIAGMANAVWLALASLILIVAFAASS